MRIVTLILSIVVALAFTPAGAQAATDCGKHDDFVDRSYFAAVSAEVRKKYVKYNAYAEALKDQIDCYYSQMSLMTDDGVHKALKLVEMAIAVEQLIERMSLQKPAHTLALSRQVELLKQKKGFVARKP